MWCMYAISMCRSRAHTATWASAACEYLIVHGDPSPNLRLRLRSETLSSSLSTGAHSRVILLEAEDGRRKTRCQVEGPRYEAARYS